MPEQKKKLLFVYYNPNSSGSFVDRARSQIQHFSENYQIYLMLGKGEGSFREIVKDFPVTLIERDLTERENTVEYIKAFFWMINFLLQRGISAIYIMDYIYWRPAELLAAKFCRVPLLGFMAFYKEDAAFKGFLPKLDFIVANSEETARSFRQQGLTKKLEVIHNFIDPSRFDVQPAHWDFLDPSSLLIGYLGVLHPIKGIENFIDAMPAIMEAHPISCFFIVGAEKQTGYLQTLEQRVLELGLEKNVHFLGHRSDVAEVMSSFDILVVPSLDEPFGYINIEAGACRIPVVASRVGGIPEIILDGETGYLVDPGRADLIAEKVSYLLSENQLRENMGVAARERVEKLFSPRVALKKWDTVIGHLLA